MSTANNLRQHLDSFILLNTCVDNRFLIPNLMKYTILILYKYFRLELIGYTFLLDSSLELIA